MCQSYAPLVFSIGPLLCSNSLHLNDITGKSKTVLQKWRNIKCYRYLRWDVGCCSSNIEANTFCRIQDLGADFLLKISPLIPNQGKNLKTFAHGGADFPHENNTFFSWIWRSVGIILLLFMCASSSWCRGLVCNVWLWLFLIILTCFSTVGQIASDCCASSSRCRGLVCNVWLWRFLIILTFFSTVGQTASDCFASFLRCRGLVCNVWFWHFLVLVAFRQLDKLPVIAVPLPHGAVGWAAVCDCDITWSYSVGGHTQLDKLPVIVVPLPHGAVGLSVCDCDVSWSYALAFRQLDILPVIVIKDKTQCYLNIFYLFVAVVLVSVEPNM